MPTLDTPSLFDGLLMLIVLLFVPFGVRRGVAKEGFVSAGILLGAAIAATWSQVWAADLRGQFDLSRAATEFTIAVGCLAVGVLVLGYGSGAALGRLRQGVMARIAGGILAAANGAVLLALLLAAIEDYLAASDDAAALDDGIISAALLRDFDWVLLGAAGVAIGLVLLGLIITPFRNRRAPVQPVDASVPMTGVGPRHRPVRMARDADAGKHEPLDAPAPRPGRFSGGSLNAAGAGIGYAKGDPVAPGPHHSLGSWPRPVNALDGAETNGHAPAPLGSEAWPTETAPVADAANVYGRPVDDSRSAPRRCPACGASIGDNDIFCADCGLTLASS